MYEGYLLLSLTVGIFAMVIGIYAYLRHSKMTINYVFFLLAVSIGIATASKSLAILSPSKEVSAAFMGMYVIFVVVQFFYLLLFMVVFVFRIERINLLMAMLPIPAIATLVYLTLGLPTPQNILHLPYGHDYDLIGAHPTILVIMIGSSMAGMLLGGLAIWRFRGQAKSQAIILTGALGLTALLNLAIFQYVGFGRFPAPQTLSTAVLLNFFALGISKYRLVGNLRAKYSQLVQNFPHPLFVVDEDGRISNLNPAALDLLKTDDKSLILSTKFGEGPSSRFRDLLRPLQRVRALEEVNCIQDYTVNSPNPGTRHYDVRLVPIPESDEAMVLLQDITTIKEAERALMSSKNEAEFYTDLLSHDINNYNQGVMAYLSIMLQDRTFPEKYRRYAEISLEQVKESTRLIANTRTLSRVRYGSMEGVGQMDLIEVLKSAGTQVVNSMPERSITVNLPRGTSPKLVLGNEFLRDVFINLLVNASKYDPSEHCEINVTVRKERRGGAVYWIVAVKDRGTGVPDSKKESIFNRFERNSGVSGSGLGLSIVRTALEGIGGGAWVEDRVPGDHTKGAAFYVRLPASVRTAN